MPIAIGRRRTVPKPNPGKTGDDKNKHGNNGNISSDSAKFHDRGHAYVHVELGGLNAPGAIVYF